MKRLSQATGALLPNEDRAGDSDAQIVRPAILVHGGPNGESVEFLSSDGPIVFDEKRIKNVVDVHNFRLEKLGKDYGGVENIPIGAYEPILDSHNDDSNDKIIGRLTGELKFEIRDVPKVGKNVPCAIALGITFLGKDTVERVKDGRIYHLSIGINEKDNSLGETSTVVQPAAPGAMLLNQGKKTQDNGGSKMDVKKLQAQHGDRLEKLSAMKDTMTSLTKKADETSGLIKLTAKKQSITHKLNALAKSGRIDRTTYRDIVENKLTKLAAMDESSLELALSLWDGVQADANQVRMTKQFGSTAASDVMEMGRELAKTREVSEIKHLRNEVAKDFKRLAGKEVIKEDEDHVEHSHEMKKKMASGPMEERIADVGKDEHVVPGQEGEAELAHHLKALGHHLAAGDMEKAKESHAMCMKHCGSMKHMSEFSGDVKSEDYKAHMGEVHKEVDELKTNMSRLAGMVQEMMGAEAEEGKHFGEISKEHEQVSA